MNGCRQNESPNIWLKHSNNPQVIHTTPGHQLTYFEVKSYVFVRNKYISSASEEKHAVYKHCLEAKVVQSSSKQIRWSILMWEDNRGWTFFWRKCYFGLWTSILSRRNSLKICFLKTHSCSLHITLIDGLEWCGLLVDYCDILSAVWTLILMAPIHCRGPIGEQVV